MCAQMEVLKKIREKGAVNGFATELAEATAADYVRMNKKVVKIEKDVNGIKKDMRVLLENQARQGGQIDLIVQRMNSPIEDERKDAIFWQQTKAMFKTPVGKMMIALFVFCLCMTGQRIGELLGLFK